MKRLLSTVLLDMKVQGRNRLYVIGIAVALVIGLPMGQLFETDTIRIILPALFLGSLGGTTYMFVAGMVLFEKSERTNDALSVTPLGRRDYILSKMITLTAFATVESVIVLVTAFGVRGFNAAILAAGVLSMGALFTLIGLAQVARYHSVTEFLVPGAIVVNAVMELPVVHILNIFPSPLWYLIPTQAQVLLMKGALQPIPTWEWVYAIGYTIVAMPVAYILADRQVSKHLLGVTNKA